MPEAERVAPSRRIQKSPEMQSWEVLDELPWEGFADFEAFWVLCPLQQRDPQRKTWQSLPNGEYEITEKAFGGRINEPFASRWFIQICPRSHVDLKVSSCWLLHEMEDDLDPTQDNALHKQWGRGAAPQGPAAGEPHGTAAREIPALLEPAWQGDGCPCI